MTDQHPRRISRRALLTGTAVGVASAAAGAGFFAAFRERDAPRPAGEPVTGATPTGVATPPTPSLPVSSPLRPGVSWTTLSFPPGAAITERHGAFLMGVADGSVVGYQAPDDKGPGLRLYFISRGHKAVLAYGLKHHVLHIASGTTCARFIAPRQVPARRPAAAVLSAPPSSGATTTASGTSGWRRRRKASTRRCRPGAKAQATVCGTARRVWPRPAGRSVPRRLARGGA